MSKGNKGVQRRQSDSCNAALRRLQARVNAEYRNENQSLKIFSRKDELY